MKTIKRTMSRAFLVTHIYNIERGQWTAAAVLDMLKAVITHAKWLNKPAWLKEATKLFNWIKTPLAKLDGAPFTMFTKGNGKLPFLSWSTLPGINCPGAAECWLMARGWCYSIKAWRYPAPFFRQLQNTILELTAYRFLIVNELKRLYHSRTHAGQNIPFRLYVDGDFKSLNHLRFWMDTLKKFPRIKAYGYSKSLHLFVQLDKIGYEWPKNYALNLSSGGQYQNTGTARYVSKLPIYRGEFIAVNVTKETKEAWREQNLTREHTKEIRDQFAGEKIFICPKYCGECTLIKENPHACGNRDKFKDIKIIIPIH
tara:strand:- start:586 stop:1524 length:939 start_codon:yes stop_codon:yes gene_type:complete